MSTWREELGDRFVDEHYGSLRGLVRTHTIHQHLLAHLPAPPAALVDVGGGAGHQAVPLAEAGYDVTIVDPSEAMLTRAEARRRELPDEVAARITLVAARGEDAPAALDGRTFAGVLCHGVVPYLDDPGPMEAALCALARPGGIVSIVAKNVEVLAARHVHEGDWAGALAAFDADHQVNGLGVDTRADTVDGLAERLRHHGVEPEAWYGVRLFTDGWAIDRPATDPEDLVLQVELEASRRDPYRRMSRLFHLIGRRPG